MKFIKLLLIAIAWTNICFSQNTREQIYNCYIAGDMTKWKTIMDDFSKQQLSNYQKLELINYYYGYIGYRIGVKNKTEAQIYIDKGDSIIDYLINNNPTAEAYAYKGAFIGFKIGLAPYKAPFIGNSSVKNVNKALEIDPNNIQANIEKANVCYFTPETFGGSKKEAVKYNEYAINLFERNPAILTKNWVYLSLLTRTAWFYADNKNYAEAKRLYEKILKIEPDYKYVKNELYPELIKTIN